MIEREFTYLAKHIPEDVEDFPHKEIRDFYFSGETENLPVLRIRKTDDKYELVKKTSIQGKDDSEKNEARITLDKTEYEALAKGECEVVEKNRYLYPFKKQTAEIDVFQGALRGLVLVEFEFPSDVEKAQFTPPEYCLADVTPELFIAGGMLAGKKYQQIESQLREFGYTHPLE